MGWLVVTAEKEDWPTAVLDFFTFDEEQKVGLIPTAFIDFGFKPSVGLYFFADDVFADDNDIRANVGYWGSDWLKFAGRDRITIDDESTVQFGGGWLRRPDYLFHGIGPRSSEDNSSRYGADKADAFLSYELGLWRLSSVQTEVGVRDVSFHESSCCEDPSIQERARAFQLAVPTGFDSGYTAGYARIDAALDTRLPDPHPGHGVRVEGFGEQDVELDPDRAPNRWVKYGGKLGGFVDLTGHRRVLGVWLSGAFADPLGGEETVPFTELTMLGGSGEMRGFLEGRLYGRSSLVTTFQYEWPVWVWLRGTVQVAAGNVFGKQLEDFDPNLLRLSSAIGFRSIGSTDHYLEVLTGFATETYERGWDVTSFRLVVGGNSGF
jgi:surface antigen Omp85-like protein